MSKLVSKLFPRREGHGPGHLDPQSRLGIRRVRLSYNIVVVIEVELEILILAIRSISTLSE